MSHVSNATTIVHDYIFQLLVELCPEKQVRDNLWDGLLLDEFTESYQRAMRHTHFLLGIERGGTLNTFNHYFNSNLQKKRSKRMTDMLEGISEDVYNTSEKFVPVSKFTQCVASKSNAKQICDDVLDALESYYKVSRKRFVDVVCQQVVFHLLLEGPGSPLKIFDPELIMKLDNEQLEQIAGEDEASKHKRQLLKREIESLEAALKILRI